MTASRRGAQADLAEAGSPAGKSRDEMGGMAGIIRRLRPLAPWFCVLALAGCQTASDIAGKVIGGDSRPPAGTPGHVAGFLGAVVADEPRAALAGRDILSAGGTAADAAVALGFALSVTLPSRAGIGAGGACLAYAPERSSINAGAPEAILFTPVAAQGTAQRGDRPPAVPMLPRGLFALHARYGRLPFSSLISPAEQLARFGAPVSRAFTRDLAVVLTPLLADPNARAVFAPNGQPVQEGARLVQPQLAATLGQMRVAGIGDLYQGNLGRRLEEVSPGAGVGVSLADLRAATPTTSAPVSLKFGNDVVAFLPPPADGGLAAAGAFQVLSGNAADVSGAQDRANAVAMAWRSRGGDPMALLQESLPTVGLPALPASTSFATLDKDGNAVVCAVTMGNLFGTGRMAPTMGFILGASPQAVTPPLLAAALAYNANIHAFRAAVGGSGQAGAPTAVAAAMLNTLRTQQPMAAEVPDPGRANVIACGQYLPGREGACGWANDPRESGLAVGSN